MFDYLVIPDADTWYSGYYHFIYFGSIRIAFTTLSPELIAA